MISKHAIVSEPGKQYPRCISSHPKRLKISLSHAREQHAIYCNTLSELGIEVIKLPRDDEYPDACFVEDTAVIHRDKALITRMAKESRRGEEDAVERILEEYFRVKRAFAPATIEGGDVIHLPNRLISGLTQRTNQEGVQQMGAWLEVPVDTISDPIIIHLKSYVNYLGNNMIIATKAFANHPILQGFNILIVPDKESYAANVLVIGDVVLMPKNHPQTQSLLTEAGFDVIALDMSEIAKCEGGLTCLSLLF